MFDSVLFVQRILYKIFTTRVTFRLCREKNLSEACVNLFALLGLWESAAELALEVDLALAKSVANMPEDESLQRQLWLSIGTCHKLCEYSSIYFRQNTCLG